MSEKGNEKNEAAKQAITVATWVIAGVAILGLFTFASHYGNKSYEHLVLSCGWAFACFAAGSAIGFLFGIPKSEGGAAAPSSLETSKSSGGGETLGQGGDGAETAAARGTVSGDGRGDYRLVPNTNLVAVSNWLTTILVGVTLVQLKEIPVAINAMALSFSEGFGKAGDTTHVAFAQALIVFFSIMGFLFGYLVTRMYLSPAMSEADQGTLACRVYKLQKDVDDLRWHNEAEVYLYDAVEIINRWEREERRGEDNWGRGDKTERMSVENNIGQDRQRELKLARGLCDAVFKREPGNERANLLSARLAALDKRYSDALNILNGVDKSRGGHAIALYNAAVCCAKLHEVKRAVEYLELAFAINEALKDVARHDVDLGKVREDEGFEKLVGYTGPREVLPTA